MKPCPSCGGQTVVHQTNHVPRYRRCKSCGGRSALTSGALCECGEPKANRRAKGCARCLEIEHQRLMAEEPRGRVLAFYERWTVGTTDDLYAWYGAEDHFAQGALWSALHKLVKAGMIERDGRVYRMRRVA